MIRARWNSEVIAESDDTVVVEGNHYFPIDSVRSDVLQLSTTTSVCPASNIKDRVAFWNGVTIENEA